MMMWLLEIIIDQYLSVRTSLIQKLYVTAKMENELVAKSLKLVRSFFRLLLRDLLAHLLNHTL